MNQDYSPGPYWSEKKDADDPCHEGLCYPLLRHCLGLCTAGSALEFGVQTGHSLSLISRYLSPTGFDSFEGLPEDWGPFTKGTFAHPPPDIATGQLVIGWFRDTLPKFDFTTIDSLRLVHIDCDLYSSTETVLDYLGPYLTSGVLVVFDEFLYDWPPNEARGGEEQRAWREFANRTQISWDVIGSSGGAWAIQIA